MEDAYGNCYDKVFLGECMGVGLTERDEDDNHVMFTLLVEDDENWFPNTETGGGGTSSYWLPELIGVLDEAHTWMKKHCEQDGEHGWKFKK